MTVYKRILVAVDGSEISPEVMQAAVDLANNQQAALRVIYVADEFIVVGEGIPFDFKKYEDSIKEYGQTILTEMESLAKKTGIIIESCIIEDTEYSPARIAEKIIQDANHWQADLLVIGTHGRPCFSHLVLGSVAEGVISLAPIPILFIRSKNINN